MEFFETLATMAWNHLKELDGVEIYETHMINASNYVQCGVWHFDGKEFGFAIESGDNEGTAIHSFGEDEGWLYEPPDNRMVFVPENDDLKEESPALWGVYLSWRKSDWLQKLEGEYNYDRTFHPGCKIEGHYRAKAAQRGLKPVHISTLNRLMDKPVAPPAEQQKL